MQDNFSSAPDMNIMKHIPPVISAGVTTDSSADLPVPPTEKRPKPKMRALRTRRIRRFVRFNVRTSDVEEALARNSIAFATRGISSPAYSMVCLKRFGMITKFLQIYKFLQILTRWQIATWDTTVKLWSMFNCAQCNPGRARALDRARSARLSDLHPHGPGAGPSPQWRIMDRRLNMTFTVLGTFNDKSILFQSDSFRQ